MRRRSGLTIGNAGRSRPLAGGRHEHGLWTGWGLLCGGVDLAGSERWGGGAAPGTGDARWGACAAPAHVVGLERQRSRRFPNKVCCPFPPNHHLSPHVFFRNITFQ
jgi:hypothetical protein